MGSIRFGPKLRPSGPKLGPTRANLRSQCDALKTCAFTITFSDFFALTGAQAASWSQLARVRHKLGPKLARAQPNFGQGRPRLSSVGCHEPASFLSVLFTGLKCHGELSIGQSLHHFQTPVSGTLSVISRNGFCSQEKLAVTCSPVADLPPVSHCWPAQPSVHLGDQP